MLREELKEFSGREIPKKEWRKINIRFLEGHKYYTVYGKEKLQPVKELHLAELKQKDKKNDDMKPEKKDKEKQKDKDKIAEAAKEAAEAKKKKEKERQSERGMATVFRIMAQNHSALSQMADSKANILISVNSIILSIIISALFPQATNRSYSADSRLGDCNCVCVVHCVWHLCHPAQCIRWHFYQGRYCGQKNQPFIFRQLS